MSGLDLLGIDQEAYNENKGSTVAEAFEALNSGVYAGKIKEVVIYTNQFGGQTLKIVGNINETGKDVTFRNDIGQKLKDGKPNEGYTARIKSACLAANVDISALSQGAPTKVNSFGKECEGFLLMGLNEKPVQLLVRHTVDTNKKLGEAYRDTNDIEGIAAQGSEDIKTFEEKLKTMVDTAVDAADADKKESVAKTGAIFEIKGYVKGGAKAEKKEATQEDKKDLEEMDF